MARPPAEYPSNGAAGSRPMAGGQGGRGQAMEEALGLGSTLRGGPWPPPSADTQAEADRFLQWAEAEGWRLPGSSWGSAAIAIGGGAQVVDSRPTGPIDTNSTGERDLWAQILSQGGSDFCSVPGVLLRQLHATAEAQLAEIEALWTEVEKTPQARADIQRLEEHLEDLQVAHVVAENEMELRRQESVSLTAEELRLQAEYDELAERLQEAKARSETLERWMLLPPRTGSQPKEPA
eukprot:gnl/TRDRNA2_/TRDRNA2_148021_c1_seq1.p1 gnl/TRDRNA2_/TRDRNA2_148021_c1~~gnl/TRDRNA2_/TRDRNA2_148021_c1_seq1.p1  ORF type:complete len:236 (+),score=52.21 gnl/TRDRNA2_/TRDRNA2_148021_c1_seq1:36-743(+)